MAEIRIKIVDENGNVLSEKVGQEEVNLLYSAEYKEGDRIVVETEEVNTYYYVQLDDAKGSSMIYVTGVITYLIPFGEKKKCFSPKLFCGNRHLISVRKAFEQEYANYRNLAENVWDQQGEVNCYPHASSNVDEIGNIAYTAFYAIDGITASEGHANWPYGSWSIKRREDAVWRLEFGRTVRAMKIVVYTRADFPHDSWGEEMTVTFSDGSKEIFPLKKSSQAQSFLIDKDRIEWLEISNFKKADDTSPFLAISQLQVYGVG